MGLKEKMKNAKESDWVTRGLPDLEVESLIIMARISAKIERRRLDMGLTQKEFAEFLGVSQSMISKWESREYNFTVKSLTEIGKMLNMECTMDIICSKNNPYKIVTWENDKKKTKTKEPKWIRGLSISEGIA